MNNDKEKRQGELSVFTGGCHCGAVNYRYILPVAVDEIPVRACACSFCTKHTARYTSHPQGQLLIELTAEGTLTGYRFGTETGEAQFCKQCGVYLFMLCEVDTRLCAALNVNSFDNFNLEGRDVPVLQLSGDTIAERLNRRRKFWIQDVQISAQPG